ncbi:sialate O-acetylesterase [Planctomycetales bacterium ZRK34]|nr:sialate O-acetylesterase [Planctomycetales bacterium ZRK34]
MFVRSKKLCVAFACVMMFAQVGRAEVIRVYLVGGQSNGDGRADVSGLPTVPVNLQAAQTDVEFFFHTQGAAHAGDSTLTTLRPGMSESNQFGPEVTLGRTLADQITNPVAVIKYANGGTNLYSQWAAGGDATTTGDGAEYVTFQNTVVAGLAALAAAHPADTIQLSGMVWMQGESDAGNTTYANAYAANLAAFIADVRLTFGADLPFVIGRLSSGQTAINATNLQTLRDAQNTVAAADALTGLVDTDTFSLKSDHLHFDPAGQQSLGSAFAEELLTLTAVPEPATGALLLPGVLLLVRRIR